MTRRKGFAGGYAVPRIGRFKLIPPNHRSPCYRIRGTEYGRKLDITTGVSDVQSARAILKRVREEAKRDHIDPPAQREMTFAEAALSYLRSGRSSLFIAPLLGRLGDMPLHQIDQRAVDACAAELGDHRAPQTNNRLVYTPIIAILRHAGVTTAIRRPKVVAGARKVEWLKPDEAFSLLSAARSFDLRLGALLCFLLYTGVRLSEGLRLEWTDVDLERRTALIRRTKNGSAITVYLTDGVADQLEHLPRKRETVFGMQKSGRLYLILAVALRRGGVSLPLGSAFHVLRHTHATWRRLYAGADTAALVGTGLWKSRAAASVYEHIDVSEEARKADLLPTPKRVESVGNGEKAK
jgi:integrase